MGLKGWQQGVGICSKIASSIKQGVAVHLYRKRILLYAMTLLEMREFRLVRHAESNRDRDERSTLLLLGQRASWDDERS